MQLLTPPPTRFTHPDHGWTIAVPHDWRTHLLEDATRPFVAVAPGDGPQPTLVVTTDDALPGDLAEWQAQVDADYAGGVLQHHQPIDAHLATIPAGRAFVRVAHHLDEYGRSLTLRQWCLVADGRGFTVTATCPTLDQSAWLRAFEQAVESFDTGTGA